MRISSRQGIVKMTVDNLPIVQFSMSKSAVNCSKYSLFQTSVIADIKVIHNLPECPFCCIGTFTKEPVNWQT